MARPTEVAQRTGGVTLARRRTMRILHVVPTYWPAVRYGGPIYSVHELCKALRCLGHEVHVYTTNVDGDRNTEAPIGRPAEVDGVKVWYFPSGIGRRLYYSPKMKTALSEGVHGFDVVHVHSVFLWPTWAAARAAHKTGVPYVLSPRGMLLKDLVIRKSRVKKSLWIKFIERQNLKHAARIHVTSLLEEAGLREFEFRLPPTVVIPNGVAPASEQEGMVSKDVLDVSSNGEYVLYLGRINWKKRLDRLVELWRSPMGARLVIAGNDEDGYLKRLTALAGRQGSREVVFLPRFISGRDKTWLFQNAALFVLPSHSENFGNTVLEAMAAGTPVVVTKEVGARETVELSGGGRVVSLEDLGPTIRGLLRDPDQRKSMGEKGRAFIESNLAWGDIARKMDVVYQEMVSEA